MINLQGAMLIDVDLLYSLHILPSPAPGAQQKTGCNSLLEFVDKTVTVCGSQLLKSWLIRPLTDLDILVERLNTVDYLICPENYNLTLQLQDSLSKIGNIPLALSCLKSGNCTWRIWKIIIGFVESTITIHTLLRASHNQHKSKRSPAS